MRDGVDRERDAVLHADFAHQFCYVSLHRALFDAEGGADFFVGAARNQHLEDFFFAVGEGDASGGEDAARGGADTFNEGRKDAPRSPYGTLIDDAESLDKLGWRCGFVNVALGAGGDSFEYAFIVHA